MADHAVRTGEAPDRPSAILAAACRVIARDGAEGLRMAAVAREAGVSNALLHYHFSTRQELLRRAFEYHDRRETQRGRERIAGLPDAVSRIRDVLAHELAEDEAVREGWVLWSEMQRLAMFHEEFRASVADRSRRWVGGVAELIRVSQAGGDIETAIDPDGSALRLTAVVDGLGQHVILGTLDRPAALDALDAALGAELGVAVGGPRS